MEYILKTGAGAGGAGGDLIKESGTATFVADVLEASRQVPVIVDFWAPWCGPCKQLGPLLEKLVREGAGTVRMVKVNVDENQDLAAQMRIQSIPAVYAFKDGRPVDAFVGALPESQLRAFVKRLTAGAANPVEEALEAAEEALEQGDAPTASEIFAQILQHDEANLAARAGLVRCYIQMGQLDQARQLLDTITGKEAGAPPVAAARAALELAEHSAGASAGLADLRARLAAHPADHQARFDLALALYGAGDAQSAIDELLELFRRDREWDDGAARKQLVKLFEALGHGHPLTVQGRKRLSSMMFA